MLAQRGFVTTQLDAMQQNTVPLGIAGTLLMIWAAMGVFGAVTSAVNHAWGVEKQRSFWKHKLVSFLMLVAAGLGWLWFHDAPDAATFGGAALIIAIFLGATAAALVFQDRIAQIVNPWQTGRK